MKRRIGLRIGFICFLLLFPTDLYAGVYFTKEEALKMAFPEATKIEKRIVIILDEQREKIKSLAKIKRVSRTFSYYEGMKGDKPIGYAVIKNTWSKLSYITFMVAIDPKGEIRMVEVLTYRELRAINIRRKRFLQQFKGKTINNRLRLNSDIDAVTGATISSRAISDGVRGILAYLYVLLQLETI